MTLRAGIARAMMIAALALLAVGMGPAAVLADGPNDGHTHAAEMGGMSGAMSGESTAPMDGAGATSMAGMGSTAPGEMSETAAMDGSGEMAAMDASGETAAMDGAGMTMSMGITDSWQNGVNRVAYPLTALLALAVAIVCYRLIEATGLVDKFALILVGLAFFFVQSIIGVAFYVTDGGLIDMSTLMFVMASFNTVAMAFIGLAFLRWYRMVTG